MIIHSVKVRNLEGIAEQTVNFETLGVTIVQGPNEIGKTGIAEAIDIILSERAESRKEKIRRIKPVGMDVGTEIEVDLEPGPYRLVYFKRYNKSPETRLRVLKPSPEAKSGVEAHERVNAILSETLDLDLWKALRVIQGTGISQAEIRSSPSLTSALDLSAGSTVATNQVDLGIFASVQQEYERYFTLAQGQPKEDLKQAARAISETRDRLGHVRSELKKLDEDIGCSETLGNAIQRLHATLGDAAVTVPALEAQWLGIEQLRGELESARLGLVAVDAAKRASGDQLTARTKLIDAEEKLGKDLAILADAIKHNAERIDAARQRFSAAKDQADRLKIDYHAAAAIARLRRDDLSIRKDGSQVREYKKIFNMVSNAQGQSNAATGILERNKVTENLLAEVEEMNHAVDLAKAKRDAARPRLIILAEAKIKVESDGTTESLHAGDSRDRIVSDLIRIRIPGAVTVDIVPGTTESRSDLSVRKAEDQLREILTRAGAISLRNARELNRIRSEALTGKKAAEKMIKDALGSDLTVGELEERIARIEMRLKEYSKTRPPEPKAPSSHAEAESMHNDADAAETAALEKTEGANASFETVRKALEAAINEQSGLEARMNAGRERLQELTSELHTARQEISDDKLRSTVGDAISAHTTALQVFQAATQAVNDAQPAALKQKLDNAKALVERLSREVREAEGNRRDIAVRLETLGEKGLWDAAEDLETELESQTKTQDNLLGLANAARTLYTVMSAERTIAQRNYAKPLADKVTELGSILFGPSFSVELDDKLQIMSRGLGGTSLMFDQLSTGAQEQLSLISRLACGLLVAPTGGVPLVIDDSLGYSDENRLKAMGAVLALAGKKCQVIVFTCYPDRYRFVGSAKTVTLN